MQARVILPPAPDKSLEIFDSHRGLWFSSIDSLSRHEGMPIVSELIVNRALGIWNIDVEEVRAGRDLDDAENVGWLFVLSDENRVCGAAEVLASDEGKGFVFGGILSSTFVNNILAGIRLLETLNLPEDSVFEMRLLRVPRAYFNGLWLAGPSDLIVPLQPLLFWSESKDILSIDDLKDRMSKAAQQLADQEAP